MLPHRSIQINFSFFCASFSIILCHTIAQPFQLKVYGREQGFEHFTVAATIQDSRKYLWIAFSGGVNRFDGSRFVDYGMKEGTKRLCRKYF